jgi:Tfp pilus assembly protein PilV
LWRRRCAPAGHHSDLLGHGRDRGPRDGRLPQLADEAGDSLIEVLLSAVVIVLIVSATVVALNSTNRATALGRERSQADALAQQDEDQLRSEPIAKLSELSVKHESLLREVTTGGTRYTITSTAQYKSDKTSTASCTSTTASADYIETASEVTWHSLGHSNPVVETGIISPPAGSTIIVQVTGASGEPVPQMTVQATGPSTVSAETSSDGCAILAVLPGEYEVNVHRPGYVDASGYSESNKDPKTTGSFYVIAEATIKKSYQFAPAGELTVNYVNSSGTSVEGDGFVAFNTLLSAPRSFGTAGTYATSLTSPKTIFPFTSAYSVYAGSCESDVPTGTPPEAAVPSGGSASVNVVLAPIGMVVREGTAPGAATEGAVMKSGVTGTIEDTGCKTVRKFTANSNGELPHPYLPFGTYSLCVTGTIGGKQRRYTSPGPIANNSASGTNVGTIYLGAGKEETSGCP